MKYARYGVAAVAFLVAVAVVSLLANTPGSGDGLLPLLLSVLLWIVLPLAGVVFVVWFVVTLNRIARDTAEQTRILRRMADESLTL